jgi:DNA-binding transcriptional ArsR family regulator
VHAFDVLGDPVRRRILELLAGGEHTSGAITEVIRGEFGITQPAVSQHLRVLRESGFATVRPEGARRLYATSTSGSTAFERSGPRTWTRSPPKSPAASVNAA